MRSGEPVRVEDRLGSESLVRWDRLAARLLPIGGKTYMSGGALRLSFDDASEVVEEIAEQRKTLGRGLRRRAKRLGVESADLDPLPIDGAILSEATPLLAQTWLATMLHRALGRAMPEISNFDGEALVLSETRFPVADPATLGEIEACLDGLSDSRATRRGDRTGRGRSRCQASNHHPDESGAPRESPPSRTNAGSWVRCF